MLQVPCWEQPQMESNLGKHFFNKEIALATNDFNPGLFYKQQLFLWTLIMLLLFALSTYAAVKK
jgi:hypothetical protein